MPSAICLLLALFALLFLYCYLWLINDDNGVWHIWLRVVVIIIIIIIIIIRVVVVAIASVVSATKTSRRFT